MTHSLSGKAAIVGIGATEFSKKSGRSELQLAVEASLAAMRDAGVEAAEIDGMSTYTIDNNAEIDVLRSIGGRELKFFSRVHYGGGGAAAPVMQAAMAVATGVADTVLCYRAMNERSEYRFGGADIMDMLPKTSETSAQSIHVPTGLRTAAAQLAMVVRRYMHEHGATSEDFGRIAVAARDFAATNPAAWFYQKPITLDDYFASRMIADPLRLLDCCQESDGAVAVIVTSVERARNLKQRPVVIRGAAQGASGDQITMFSFYREDITSAAEAMIVGSRLFEQSGLSPADIDLAILYDHFGPSVLLQLEAYGFCDRGEAVSWVREGRIGRGGRTPVNTHGGQVGEAYIHGMNGIAEAVRQLRGTAVNQVVGARNILVSAGIALPTSGLILGVE